MRLDDHPFFHPGSDPVADCYLLAKYFRCSPSVFLAETLETIRLHVERTAALIDNEAPPDPDEEEATDG